jgi:hypothetical protein
LEFTIDPTQIKREKLKTLKNNVMTKNVKLLPPRMPNFILLEKDEWSKKRGVSEEYKIHVTDLTKDEAKQYGQLMMDEFIKHYNNLKK